MRKIYSFSVYNAVSSFDIKEIVCVLTPFSSVKSFVCSASMGIYTIDCLEPKFNNYNINLFVSIFLFTSR